MPSYGRSINVTPTAAASPKAERALRLDDSGLDVEAIAERMGITVRAVYNLVDRARSKGARRNREAE